MKRRVIRKRENTSVRIAVLRKSHGNLERICLRTCTVLGTVLLPYRNRHTRAKCEDGQGSPRQRIAIEKVEMARWWLMLVRGE